MADVVLHVDLLVPPKAVRWALVGLLFALLTPNLNCDTFSMTTWLPAPVGAYQKLITGQHTFLARDGGVVTAGTGVGTTNPAVKLDVLGDAYAPMLRLTGGGSPFSLGPFGIPSFFSKTVRSWTVLGVGTVATPSNGGPGMALSIGNGVVGSFPATLVAAQNNCWPSPSTIMCVAIGGVYYTMQSGVKPAMATTSHPPLSPNYEKICCPCPAGGCGLTP